jgi:diguanylate cyclase (GGDEF)-like protein
MQSWDDAFAELRVQFLREAGPRLDEIERLLGRLAGDPADRDGLRDLMRRFHGFAGSGSTYGLPTVTDLGLEGEQACNRLLHEGTPPGPADLDHGRRLLAALRDALASSSSTPAASAPSAPSEPAARSADILVVDDDPSVLDFLVRRVEQEGMTARRATTKAEAVRAIESRLPDGLITDVRLADGFGYELVGFLRERPHGEAPAVLIVSVLTGFLDKVEAMHCGADGFFEKPVDWEALMRRLLHLLDRNRPESGRVLAVEDDPQQSSFVRAVLSSAGYEVRVCDDPRHFEMDLGSFRPDLVLMDVVLPGISGYDLARYLRQQERHATLPILFLTTEGRIDARIEGARAGGDDYLVKPTPPALLLTAVTARIERARFVKSLLGRDGLTRLLNHTTFLERAAVVLASGRRDASRSAAWVMIDVDHFKTVNDRYGHPTGDRVLTSLAALLRRRLRQSDTIGRYGGEEFAVLLDDLSQEEAVRLLERLLKEFAAQPHHAPDGSAFHVTFSAGVAMLDPATMDLNAWRGAADVALYAAKDAGRSQVAAGPPASRGSGGPLV